MRYGNPVVAVLTHQSALAARGNASPLDSAYLDRAGDLLFMVSEGIRHVIETERRDRAPLSKDDVALDDGTVSAHGRLGSGERGAVIVRPERIVLCPAGEQVPSGWNMVRATVTEQVYLGMGRRLVLHRKGGDRVSVREPAGRWSAAEVGGEVLATWRAEDGVLLSEDADAERIHT